MPDKQQIVLSEGALREIEERCANEYEQDIAPHSRMLADIGALCQTVRALMDLAYVPKVLPDDETITYCDQAERLLREKVANGDEIRAVLDALGEDAVDVREDGGPEDIYASLAVSVAKLQSRLAQVEQERDALRKIAEDALRFRVEMNGSCNHDEHMTKLCTQCEIRELLENLAHKGEVNA